jgi:hypothetical protein
MAIASGVQLQVQWSLMETAIANRNYKIIPQLECNYCPGRAIAHTTQFQRSATVSGTTYEMLLRLECNCLCIAIAHGVQFPVGATQLECKCNWSAIACAAQVGQTRITALGKAESM